MCYRAGAYTQRDMKVYLGHDQIYYNGFSEAEILAFENTLKRILKNLDESENRI